MKLREIYIKNFRCLEEVSIPIDDNTILVGENNTGKTAVLDALKIALTRRQLGRTLPFSEYDYYMVKPEDSPQTSEGIIIELWFREERPEEWPDSLIQALNDIIQTDPTEIINSIGLRLSSKYDFTIGEIVPKLEFLALDKQPLGGKGADYRNFTKFLDYIRAFYLSALRDSASEFSARSQFWGRILRDLKVSEEQRKTLSEELEKLNNEILKADPRTEKVINSLNRVNEIMELGGGAKTAIQALPFKPWDLLTKSEVVVKARGSDVDFPLARHGQGMQSTAIIFLFQAYIDVLLKPSFKPETEAILALEEPEAHLHPHTIRALANNLNSIPSQKIISCHSPYFIQEIPFAQLRLFRRTGPKSKVLYIKRKFSAQIPNVEGIKKFCSDNPKYKYIELKSSIFVNGKVEEDEYRKLLALYPGRQDVHKSLKRFKIESSSYLSERDLTKLETFAKRIRGEVLFARAWLLCEGQSEYLLLRYFAELIGKPLDQAGITIIDFKNNGSPGIFAALAKAFEMPWLMICDNDQAGRKFIKAIRDRGFAEKDIKGDIVPLPGDNMTLERFLLKNGFLKEYLEILNGAGISLIKKETDEGYEDEFVAVLEKDKVEYATSLIELLKSKSADMTRVPELYRDVIEKVVSKAAI